MTRKMKNSGIEWIREIPKNWNVVPLKSVFSFGKGLSITKENLIESGFPVISYGQIHAKDATGTSIKDQHIRYVSEDYLRTSLSSLAKQGDIIVADTSEDLEGAGNATFVDQPTIFAGYHTVLLKNKGIADGKYIAYLMKTDQWRKQIRTAVWAVKVYSISQAVLRETSVLLPPIPEQNAITKYLDHKTSQINALVSNIESQITKLDEYKKALITEAVTKGLDPDVEMKDSGVEWIGKIPLSWKIGRVKNILDYADKYPIGDGDHGLIKPADYKDSGIPYIRVQNLTWEGTLDLSKVVYISSETNQKIRGSQLKPNDILIAKTGTIGKVGIIPNDMPISNTTSHVGKITISKKHNPSFLLYVLSSNLVREQLKEISAMQSTRPELGISNMKNLVITIPSRDVQDEIAVTLSRKTAQIDLAVRKQYQLIDKLQEYKKSLIYECVTGKKEVFS